MRWGSNKNDDRRYIIKYAWYPIRIENRWFEPKVQWRWFERVKIRQVYETDPWVDTNIFKEISNSIKVFLFGGIWKNEMFVEFDKSELREKKTKEVRNIRRFLKNINMKKIIEEIDFLWKGDRSMLITMWLCILLALAVLTELGFNIYFMR